MLDIKYSLFRTVRYLGHCTISFDSVIHHHSMSLTFHTWPVYPTAAKKKKTDIGKIKVTNTMAKSKLCLKLQNVIRVSDG